MVSHAANCKVSSSETPRDKGSVIVSAITPVYTLRKKRKMETVSVLTRLPCPMVPWRRVNSLNGRGRENTFDVDCRDGCTQK